jgi:hypothetical protein
MNLLEELDLLIRRSDEFEEDLFSLFEGYSFQSNNKSKAVIAMCNLALEHGSSLRELIRIHLPTSAIALLRLQYEAIVRAIWVLYAASETATAKLIAPLTKESEKAANNSLPSFSTMMNEIRKRGPSGVHRLLTEFRDYSWRPLNSFVHSGIHAVNRHRQGYPTSLLMQSIRQSNNLTHMSGVSLACLLEDAQLNFSVASLFKKYADCLHLNDHSPWPK